MHQQQAAFENTVVKGEIARNEQFLLFPQCFLLNQMMVSTFVHIFEIISLFAVELEEQKIGISDMELNSVMYGVRSMLEVYFTSTVTFVDKID